MEDNSSNTLTHNLELTSPCSLSQIQITDSGTPVLGTNDIIVNFHHHQAGVFIWYKDSNTIGIEIDEQLFNEAGYGSGDAPSDISTSGYVRILLWK
jgi:hypothetical protein